MVHHQIPTVDFSESIEAILQKYSSQDKVTDECLADLARLWGFSYYLQTGEIETQTETIPLQEPLYASIYFARSDRDYWLHGISVHTTTAGIHSPPSFFNPLGYFSQNDTREAAVAEIAEFFKQQAIGSTSTRLLLRQTLNILNDYSHPTLDLFQDGTGGKRGR